MEYPMLELAIEKAGKKKYEVARMLGISAPALSYKLKGRSPFTFDEQTRVAEFLGFRREFLFLNFGPPPSMKLSPKTEGGDTDAQ